MLHSTDISLWHHVALYWHQLMTLCCTPLTPAYDIMLHSTDTSLWHHVALYWHQLMTLCCTLLTPAYDIMLHSTDTVHVGQLMTSCCTLLTPAYDIMLHSTDTSLWHHVALYWHQLMTSCCTPLTPAYDIMLHSVWGPVVQWLVQRFRSERLRVWSRRSATFTPSTHVRRQSLPVWPPTLNNYLYLFFFTSLWHHVALWGPVVQWLVQRFRSERLRVRSRRSATFTPSAHVRRQSLPVWPPTLNNYLYLYLYSTDTSLWHHVALHWHQLMTSCCTPLTPAYDIMLHSTDTSLWHHVALYWHQLQDFNVLSLGTSTTFVLKDDVSTRIALVFVRSREGKRNSYMASQQERTCSASTSLRLCHWVLHKFFLPSVMPFKSRVWPTGFITSSLHFYGSHL